MREILKTIIAAHNNKLKPKKNGLNNTINEKIEC